MKPILLKVKDINGRDKVIDFTDPDVRLEQGDGFVTVHLDKQGNRFHVPGNFETLQIKINESDLPVIAICPGVTEGTIYTSFGRPNPKPSDKDADQYRIE